MSENPTSDYAPAVLVVDDDWMNREMMQAHLAAAGYCVRTAHSGEKALEIALDTPPDLVLLDIRMSGMDGYETCRRLKANPGTQFTPVIMVTALETDEDKLEAIEAGADDFLTKPFSSLLLLTRVKSLLRIKRLHDELEARNHLLRQVLARYVDENIARIILADPEKHLKLGGETRKVTVCFADIRGFTAFAERSPAQEVLTVLNRIFSDLTEVIFRHGGTFDKYIGDELMAFFGAPVATEHDTLNALRMALELRGEFRRIKAAIDSPALAELDLGIGLHTGEATVGNVGSERVMSYTVIGDTVNIARRLQQIAHAGQILISEATYREVEDRVVARHLEARTLAGKTQATTLYQLEDVV